MCYCMKLLCENEELMRVAFVTSVHRLVLPPKGEIINSPCVVMTAVRKTVLFGLKLPDSLRQKRGIGCLIEQQRTCSPFDLSRWTVQMLGRSGVDAFDGRQRTSHVLDLINRPSSTNRKKGHGRFDELQMTPHALILHLIHRPASTNG